MNLEKISIIIPVYNVEHYLDRCVQSVVEQTYSNLEIILVDDGSTDKSKDMCDLWEKRDDRIFVYHKTNGGLGSARNYGYQKATGTYVIFLDSDDYIEPHTFEKMATYIKDDYDMICCGFDRIEEKTGKVFSREMIHMPFDELQINSSTIMETAFLNPSGWGKLWKKEVIKNITFSNNKNSIEDILFYLEIVPKLKKVKYVKEVLWHYMVREHSLIMSITEVKADLFEKELLKIKEKYEFENYEKEMIQYLTLQVFIHNCISIPSRLYNNKEVNMKRRIRHIKNYMDENFGEWRKLPIRVKKRGIKVLALKIVRLLYITNTFVIFLVLYNFMIHKLKIDIKW